MGLITLVWKTEGQDIEVVVDESIATCDLLEVIELFIRVMGRTPSGELDFIQDKL